MQQWLPSLTRHQHKCALPAGDIGNGWTLDTSDGALLFKCDGEDVMALLTGGYEGSSPVWSKEHGLHRDAFVQYSPAKVTIRSNWDGNRLQHSTEDDHQGRFSNANREAWETMTLLKM
jgi:hypothetical protein